MNYFPTFLDLKRRSCLVVGGGENAARKLRLLLKAGADVTVVAPRINDEIAGLANRGAIRLTRRGFVDGDARGRALIIGATGAAEVDERVAMAAGTAGVPVNVVDRPDLSRFLVPAIVDRDPVVIAIGTGGAAPVLTRRLRQAIEGVLPARLGALAKFARSFRAAVRATIPDSMARRRFWEGFFDGPIADRVLAGGEPAARESMIALVNRWQGCRNSEISAGAVAIVGTGPGDPDLLTLRALRLMQRADIVIHDRSIDPEILDYARRDALRIDVGASAERGGTQDQTISLMLAHALAGRRVVRLEAGDPLVLGQGGEALARLRRHGVDVELVPGVAAAGRGASEGARHDRCDSAAERAVAV